MTDKRPQDSGTKYEGERFAKMFSDKCYFGSIVSDDNPGYWTVRYDDGDVEDLDEQEVVKGIELCESEVERSNYTMWEIFNVEDEELKDPLFKFFLFILERQRCWERRCIHSDPSLWTNSYVLRDYFFCNNYRELDRGTCFFHSHIVDLFGQVSSHFLTQLEWIQTVLWASYCYRLANKIESFTSAGKAPTSTFNGIPSLSEWPEFRKLVQRAQFDNARFFTGAHQTCGYANYLAWMDKVHQEDGKILKLTAKNVYKASIQGNLAECCKHLRSLPGCGAFLCWQICCDLLESNCLPSCCKDVDFCVLGPGAKAGIDEIFLSSSGVLKKSDKRISKAGYMDFARTLVNLQDTIFKDISQYEDFRQLKFPYWRNKRLTLKEMEHMLCEFSKFERIERAAMNTGNMPMGLRRRVSRAEKLDSQTCKGCKADIDDLVYCDTCNNGYCFNCDDSVKNFTSNSWICQRCRDLEAFDWGSNDIQDSITNENGTKNATDSITNENGTKNATDTKTENGSKDETDKKTDDEKKNENDSDDVKDSKIDDDSKNENDSKVDDSSKEKDQDGQKETNNKNDNHGDKNENNTTNDNEGKSENDNGEKEKDCTTETDKKDEK